MIRERREQEPEKGSCSLVFYEIGKMWRCSTAERKGIRANDLFRAAARFDLAGSTDTEKRAGILPRSFIMSWIEQTLRSAQIRSGVYACDHASAMSFSRISLAILISSICFSPEISRSMVMGPV